jgi:hypothetical protein
LKATPPGFTDLVPRRMSRGEQEAIRVKADATTTFHLSAINPGSKQPESPAGILWSKDFSIEALKIELVVLRKENEEHKRKLKELGRGSKWR